MKQSAAPKPPRRHRDGAEHPAPPAPTLTALRLFPTTFTLRPAPGHRDWMDRTAQRFAYRCLPLLVANQAGWILTSGRTVIARWGGKATPDDLTVRSPDGEPPPAHSQFGYGILTWEVPFLFRTSPGYNLLVRGPANWWKEGATPLEGLVETDWAVATFTMNWKLTRPRRAVRFEPGDPLCMLVPQRRGELESFSPRVRSLRSEPELRRQFRAWEKARNQALAAIEDPRRPAGRPAEWQLHYLRGTSPGGAGASEHQTRLRLAEFLENRVSPSSAR